MYSHHPQASQTTFLLQFPLLFVKDPLGQLLIFRFRGPSELLTLMSKTHPPDRTSFI